MASHHQNQLVARCIVVLADSARFADNRLAAAYFAVALADLAEDCGILAVAAGSAALPVVAVPIRRSVQFLDS